MQNKNKKYNNNLEVLHSKKKIDYMKSMIFLENRVAKILENKEKELVWFLEHPSVYTTGRSYYESNKYIRNIPVLNTTRGGKITWHGPGQRIIYLAINLRRLKTDIRIFVNSLENYIIESLREINIKCFRKPGLIGIWTKNNNNNDAKIASLGLRVSKGIIYHGISINVNCDLKYFYNINPCGIANASVTSIKEIKNKEFDINNFDNILENNLNIFY